MLSFTTLLGAMAATVAIVTATPHLLQSRQAGDWSFQYYEGEDHDCQYGSSINSSTYSGGIGCIMLGMAETPEEAPPGGSIGITSTGGKVTPKLWFDTACTDPVDIIQSSNNPNCYVIDYPYQGGPVAITADQAGA